MKLKELRRKRSCPRHLQQKRRGVIVVFAAVCLAVVFCFVGFGVDTGRIVLEQNKMQNACDAASLAAIQEITAVVWQAGENGGSPHVSEQALASARQVAADVASANGVYVDPNVDVVFGKREYDASTGEWPISWGQQPYNTVKVTARRDQDDVSKPDGRLPLAFGWALGKPSTTLTTSAAAFVQARDMVLVLDFSGSMNDDSTFSGRSGPLGLTATENALDDMWDAMLRDDPKWPGTSKSKFKPTGFGKIDSYNGTYVKSTNSETVFETLELGTKEAGYDYGVSQTKLDAAAASALAAVNAYSQSDMVRLLIDQGYVDAPPEPSNGGGNGQPKGNNGVGNGEDPQPPGNPPVNDGPGTGPGNPGNKGGVNKNASVNPRRPLVFAGYRKGSVRFSLTARRNRGGNSRGGNSGGGNSGGGNSYDPIQATIDYYGLSTLQGLFNSNAATIHMASTGTSRNTLVEQLSDTGYLPKLDETLAFPFPQAGTDQNDKPKSEPSEAVSKQLWKGYINYVKSLDSRHPYYKRYGYRTLMSYLQASRAYRNQSEDLWRTPHYPFHAVKEGTTMFLTFLESLGFGDEVGLVSYGTYSKVEVFLDDGSAYVDITSDPITHNYAEINTIQTHKQASHYASRTGMGFAIEDAKELLLGNQSDPNSNGYSRAGALPMIIIMTDGQTNEGPNNWSLPNDWDWADWTDYDGDGYADYSTSDRDKQYAFWQATQAIDGNIALHTMSVGKNADTDLMEAIAFAGGGTHLNIPGGSTIEEMESQAMAAFANIASKVPPAKLVYDDSTASGGN